ncbi:hypothetical protein KA005_04925 [bacterium]|nr:hypothetical protein [bacterium]
MKIEGCIIIIPEPEGKMTADPGDLIIGNQIFVDNHFAPAILSVGPSKDDIPTTYFIDNYVKFRPFGNLKRKIVYWLLK